MRFRWLGWRTPWKTYETVEGNGFHKPEIQFSPARISSVFKNWFPLIVVMVSSSRKKLSSKVTVSIREKTPSPIAGMKDSFKNKIPLDKKSFLRLEFLKKCIKMVCITQKTRFHYPEWSIRWKIRFLDTEKLLLLARKSKKMVSTSRKTFFF